MGRRASAGLAQERPGRLIGRATVAAFVYLLRCADGTLYCGWSTDPERRLRQHQNGTASRYTRRRRPVELVWSAECADRSEALREEARIKRLPVEAKRALVAATPPG
jgi:putative endonuclease